MSSVLDAWRGFRAWWMEGLTRIGAHLTHVYDGPSTPVARDADDGAEQEVWDEERARIAVTPWWL